MDVTHQLPSLFASLRAAGIEVGVREQLAVRDLLLALAAKGELPGQPRKLRSLIQPIVCGNAEEVSKFRASFNELFPPSKNEIDLRIKPSRSHKSRNAPRLWLLGVISVGLAVWGTIFAIRSTKSTLTTQPPIVAEPIELPNQPEIPPKKEVPAELPPTTPVAPKPDPIPPAGDEMPVGSEAPIYPKPAFDIPRQAPVLSRSEQQRERLASLQRFLPEAMRSPFILPMFGGIAAIALLAGLITLIRRLRLRYLNRRLIEAAQESSDDVIFFVPTTSPYSSSLLRLAAHRMRRHEGRLAGKKFDFSKTIRASIRQGGWFTPVARTEMIAPEYLVLINCENASDHRGSLASELISALNTQGVPSTVWTFQGVPDLCYPRHGHGRPLALDELHARYPDHRPLVFSDRIPGGALSEDDGLQDLQLWEETGAWFSDRAYPSQSDRSRAQMIAAPGGLAGLNAFANVLAGSAKPELHRRLRPPALFENDLDTWTSLQPPEAALLRSGIQALRHYLGQDGFLWLSACSVYPELNWQLTLALGGELRQKKRLPQDPDEFASLLERMTRLPWLRQGMLPDWLRRQLHKELKRRDRRLIQQAIHNILAKGSAEVAGLPASGLQQLIVRNPGIFRRIAEQIRITLGRTQANWTDAVCLDFFGNSLAFRLRMAMASPAITIVLTATLLFLATGIGFGVKRTLAERDIEEGRELLAKSGGTDNFSAMLLAAKAIGFEGFGRQEAPNSFLAENPVLLPRDGPEYRAAIDSITRNLGTPIPIWSRASWAPDATVNDVVWSPDGKWFASTKGPNVELWDAKTGTLKHLLTGSGGEILSLSVSPDATTLAGATSSGAIYLWLAETGKERATLRGHQGRVNDIEFGPNGNLFASAAEDRSVKLWYVGEYTEKATFTDNRFAFTAVSFSPAGETLAGGTEIGEIAFWNVLSKQEKARIAASEFGTRINDLSFGPNGLKLAVASDVIKIWSVSNRTISVELTSPLVIDTTATSIEFLADGRLACGTPEGVVRMWASTKYLTNPVFEIRAHNGSVTDLHVGLDGKTIATCGLDGQPVRLWGIPDRSPNLADYLSRDWLNIREKETKWNSRPLAEHLGFLNIPQNSLVGILRRDESEDWRNWQLYLAALQARNWPIALVFRDRLSEDSMIPQETLTIIEAATKVLDQDRRILDSAGSFDLAQTRQIIDNRIKQIPGFSKSDSWVRNPSFLRRFPLYFVVNRDGAELYPTARSDTSTTLEMGRLFFVTATQKDSTLHYELNSRYEVGILDKWGDYVPKGWVKKEELLQGIHPVTVGKLVANGILQTTGSGSEEFSIENMLPLKVVSKPEREMMISKDLATPGQPHAAKVSWFHVFDVADGPDGSPYYLVGRSPTLKAVEAHINPFEHGGLEADTEASDSLLGWVPKENVKEWPGNLVLEYDVSFQALKARYAPDQFGASTKAFASPALVYEKPERNSRVLATEPLEAYWGEFFRQAAQQNSNDSSWFRLFIGNGPSPIGLRPEYSRLHMIERDEQSGWTRVAFLPLAELGHTAIDELAFIEGWVREEDYSRSVLMPKGEVVKLSDGLSRFAASLERFINIGQGEPASRIIHALADSTYSLATGGGQLDESRFNAEVSRILSELSQTGSTVGTVLGITEDSSLPINPDGILAMELYDLNKMSLLELSKIATTLRRKVSCIGWIIMNRAVPPTLEEVDTWTKEKQFRRTWEFTPPQSVVPYVYLPCELLP